MNPETFSKPSAPYFVKQTPSGFVVVCEGHLVTDEIKECEAIALRDALNREHQNRMAV